MGTYSDEEKYYYEMNHKCVSRSWAPRRGRTHCHCHPALKACQETSGRGSPNAKEKRMVVLLWATKNTFITTKRTKFSKSATQKEETIDTFATSPTPGRRLHCRAVWNILEHHYRPSVTPLHKLKEESTYMDINITRPTGAVGRDQTHSLQSSNNHHERYSDIGPFIEP